MLKTYLQVPWFLDLWVSILISGLPGFLISGLPGSLVSRFSGFLIYRLSGLLIFRFLLVSWSPFFLVHWSLGSLVPLSLVSGSLILIREPTQISWSLPDFPLGCIVFSTFVPLSHLCFCKSCMLSRNDVFSTIDSFSSG